MHVCSVCVRERLHVCSVCERLRVQCECVLVTGLCVPAWGGGGVNPPWFRMNVLVVVCGYTEAVNYSVKWNAQSNSTCWTDR